MSLSQFKQRLAEILQNVSTTTASSNSLCFANQKEFGGDRYFTMADDVSSKDDDQPMMITGSNYVPSFFSQPDPSRSFGLEVDGQIFWIPKDGLCSYSPVFKRMLYGKFAESDRDTVKLPQKKVDEVLELLLCLFPTPFVKKVDDSNVDLLLDFADEYEILDLSSRCSDFLQQKLDLLRNGDERLIEILILASKHRLRQILFRIVERCAECFELEKFEPYFDRLSSEVLGALAWHKCQKVTAAKQQQAAADSFMPNHFSSLCNNCRNGHTQNRCTVCGGAQKCPLCSSSPRRSRPCQCSSLVASLNRGASMAAMAESLDEVNGENRPGGSGAGNFDGAKMLLIRM